MENKFSLIDFVDCANEALFYQRKFPDSLIKDLPEVITLQGKPGAYAGMFALPSGDHDKEFRTFTGEVVKSNAARRHILGEETCRILGLLDEQAAAASSKQALDNISVRIHETDTAVGTRTGIYCCGTCSCSFWRNLAAGNFDHQEERLSHGLRKLKECRSGNGRWRRFPFYYTLLALNELDHPAARAEIAYVLPVLEKLFKRRDTTSTFGQRRKDLIERLLTLACKP